MLYLHAVSDLLSLIIYRFLDTFLSFSLHFGDTVHYVKTKFLFNAVAS